jgi:hypothetical protein
MFSRRKKVRFNLAKKISLKKFGRFGFWQSPKSKMTQKQVDIRNMKKASLNLLPGAEVMIDGNSFIMGDYENNGDERYLTPILSMLFFTCFLLVVRFFS